MKSGIEITLICQRCKEKFMANREIGNLLSLFKELSRAEKSGIQFNKGYGYRSSPAFPVTEGDDETAFLMTEWLLCSNCIEKYDDLFRKTVDEGNKKMLSFLEE